MLFPHDCNCSHSFISFGNNNSFTQFNISSDQWNGFLMQFIVHSNAMFSKSYDVLFAAIVTQKIGQINKLFDCNVLQKYFPGIASCKLNLQHLLSYQCERDKAWVKWIWFMLRLRTFKGLKVKSGCVLIACSLKWQIYVWACLVIACNRLTSNIIACTSHCIEK